jgi:hypothetical protein
MVSTARRPRCSRRRSSARARAFPKASTVRSDFSKRRRSRSLSLRSRATSTASGCGGRPRLGTAPFASCLRQFESNELYTPSRRISDARSNADELERPRLAIASYGRPGPIGPYERLLRSGDFHGAFEQAHISGLHPSERLLKAAVFSQSHRFYRGRIAIGVSDYRHVVDVVKARKSESDEDNGLGFHWSVS